MRTKIENLILWEIKMDALTVALTVILIVSLFGWWNTRPTIGESKLDYSRKGKPVLDLHSQKNKEILLRYANMPNHGKSDLNNVLGYDSYKSSFDS